MMFQKVLFMWQSMPIFSFIGYILIQLFKKPGNWRHTCKQASWTFYTSNDVEKKNFHQWKTSSENYEPIRVWLWLVYRFTKNYCRLQLFSEFIQTQKRYISYLYWQNRYPILKTTCHIKLIFFLWTKLLESLLLQNISYLSLRL